MAAGLLEHGLREEQARRMLPGGSRTVHLPGPPAHCGAQRDDDEPVRPASIAAGVQAVDSGWCEGDFHVSNGVVKDLLLLLSD